MAKFLVALAIVAIILVNVEGVYHRYVGRDGYQTDASRFGEDKTHDENQDGNENVADGSKSRGMSGKRGIDAIGKAVKQGSTCKPAGSWARDEAGNECVCAKRQRAKRFLGDRVFATGRRYAYIPYASKSKKDTGEANGSTIENDLAWYCIDANNNNNGGGDEGAPGFNKNIRGEHEDPMKTDVDDSIVQSGSEIA